MCLAVFAKTPPRKRLCGNVSSQLMSCKAVSKNIALRKGRQPATNCESAFSFETTMEESHETHEMSSAQITQPTKADEPGSPRTDGRGTESVAGHPQLNPYSCLSCRKKKKKCERVYPCVNCRKAGADCLFVPRRPSTRPKTTQGMLERLQHLEGVIGHLRDNYNQGATQQSPKTTEVRANAIIEEREATRRSSPTNNRGTQNDAVTELGTELGRLATGDGRSRYISSSFWASLDEEVCHLSGLTLLEI